MAICVHLTARVGMWRCRGQMLPAVALHRSLVSSTVRLVLRPRVAHESAAVADGVMLRAARRRRMHAV